MSQHQVRSLFFLVIASFLLTGCFSPKRLQYFTDFSKDKKNFKTSEINTLYIQPNSQLYITITSFDEYDMTVLRGTDNDIRINGPETLQLVGYTVDDAGYINYPLIGNVYVKGLTLQQAGELIEENLKGYLNSPSVSVRFINKSITVLGEVNNPGRISYTKDQITILQAIGMAGDLTTAGNRQKVQIIRGYNNQVVKETVNLQNESLLLSDYYYLEPDDIIYVQPTGAARFRLATGTYSLILSTITTALLIFDYVNR